MNKKFTRIVALVLAVGLCIGIVAMIATYSSAASADALGQLALPC